MDCLFPTGLSDNHFPLLLLVRLRMRNFYRSSGKILNKPNMISKRLILAYTIGRGEGQLFKAKEMRKGFKNTAQAIYSLI